jgi:hypothetical protein
MLMPDERGARLYKQQSRRPMSENRRLCLSPHAPCSSVAQKGNVWVLEPEPASQKLCPRGLPGPEDGPGPTRQAYNFAHSLSMAPNVRGERKLLYLVPLRLAEILAADAPSIQRAFIFRSLSWLFRGRFLGGLQHE